MVPARKHNWFAVLSCFFALSCLIFVGSQLYRLDRINRLAKPLTEDFVASSEKYRSLEEMLLSENKLVVKAIENPESYSIPDFVDWAKNRLKLLSAMRLALDEAQDLILLAGGALGTGIESNNSEAIRETGELLALIRELLNKIDKELAKLRSV